MDDNDADGGKGFVFINDMVKGNDEVDDISIIGVAVDDSDRNVVVGIDVVVGVVVVAPVVNNIDEMVIVLPVSFELVVEASV